jgi:hypothetical protein
MWVAEKLDWKGLKIKKSFLNRRIIIIGSERVKHIDIRLSYLGRTHDIFDNNGLYPISVRRESWQRARRPYNRV